MPLIQIEQDCSEVFEGARRAILTMAADMRENSGNTEAQNTYVMYTLGYLAALITYDLVSTETHTQLLSEMDQQRDRVWAEDDAAASSCHF